jgi:hypothetical protein
MTMNTKPLILAPLLQFFITFAFEGQLCECEKGSLR